MVTQIIYIYTHAHTHTHTHTPAAHFSLEWNKSNIIIFYVIQRPGQKTIKTNYILIFKFLPYYQTDASLTSTGQINILVKNSREITVVRCIMGEPQISIKCSPKHSVAMSVNKQRQTSLFCVRKKLENRKVKVEIAQGRVRNF